MEEGEGEDTFPLDEGHRRAEGEDMSRKCPYLSTVERKALDFDMEKVCSVTLSGQHVYCCLVCGNYFRGRGKQTPAYTHSIQAAGHHVFMSMDDGRFFCLPEAYEVLDASLDDIRFALKPSFDATSLATIDEASVLSADAHGRPYLPGLVGINDLSRTDYIGATVQALAHIQPFRDFFLVSSNTESSSSPLVRVFGELIRRLWCPLALKAVVSPHDFLNTVSEASSRTYGVGKAAEAIEFMTWLLNTLHRDLLADAGGGGHPPPTAGAKRGRDGKPPTPTPHAAPQGTIVTRVFGGEVEVTLLWSELEEERAKEREAALRRKAAEEERNGEGEGEDPTLRRKRLEEAVARGKPVFPRTTVSPFLMLSLDLPPAPLFREREGGVAIPQVPVYELLSKFDGERVAESLKGQYRERRRYRVLSLPSYLILAVKRFTRNAFFTERNPTIVPFPVRNLEMRPYVRDGAEGGDGADSCPPTDEGDLESLSTPALRALLRRYGAPPPSSSSSSTLPMLEKAEVVDAVRAALKHARETGSLRPSSTKYDLAANVVHEVAANADAVAGSGNAVAAAAASSSSGSGVAAAAASAMSSTPTSAQEAAIVAAGAKVNENQAAAAVRLAAAISDPILRGKHKVHVQAGGGGWYEVQDAHVAEALPQLIGVSDTVVMIYARR